MELRKKPTMQMKNPSRISSDIRQKIPMMHEAISYKSQKMMDKKTSSRPIPMMHWVVQYASEMLSEISVLGTMIASVVLLMHRISMLRQMTHLVSDHIDMIRSVVSSHMKIQIIKSSPMPMIRSVAF